MLSLLLLVGLLISRNRKKKKKRKEKKGGRKKKTNSQRDGFLVSEFALYELFEVSSSKSKLAQVANGYELIQPAADN